jgi:hypothetical protein
MLGLRDLGTGTAVLSLANQSPCRQTVDLGGHWQVLAQLDGLDQHRRPGAGSRLQLAPWQLGFWQIKPA